ncbi:GPI ethanolamine phosphate transferase 3 isoform X2 [Periplaneta americana]|uniref:GPI ethanolamine phosphate transferase 3 isoform X2 n=1 Tax=Periplaneta americana TaxID=6978 RepID=UPI0037E94C1D
MERQWKYFLLLLWFSYLFVCGVLLFTRGFLLNREVMPQRSSCKQTNILCSTKNHGVNYIYNSSFNDNPGEEPQECLQEELWMGSSDSIDYKSTCGLGKTKVVLIIIDALKFDFVYFDEKLKNEDCLPYQNKLTVIHDLLSKKPNNTRLFKFIADPPTTTMQRLKGLTTGSLPTFIDIGSNFATPEINEDNVLDQLRSQNKSIVFMGDDTWSGLYPKRFIREYSYPSFNVWDLDTVDNGIMNHLLPEIVKKDWSLLVAHFLGVDHCGHRYGPNNPEMARKLNEMNDMLGLVMDTVDDDTMVIVAGDHGMTGTGDHGGDSEAEVTAAMFVYSSKPLLSADIAPRTATVNQIDLVPTLAAILGLPIPYANLGTTILEALPSQNRGILSDWRFALRVLWENVQQTTEYLTQYSEKTNQLSQEKLSLLQQNYATIKESIKSLSSTEQYKNVFSLARECLSQARQMCEEVWVQFDAVLMTSGLLLMFVTIFFNLVLVDSVPGDKLKALIDGTYLYIVFGCLVVSVTAISVAYCLGLVDKIEVSMFFSTGMLSIALIFMAIIRISNQWQSQVSMSDWQSTASRLLLLLSLCGMFSNSYIVEEASVLSFLFLTAVWLLVFHSKPEPVTKIKASASWYSKALITPQRLKLLMLVTLLSVLVRMSAYFWQCREEQVGCESFTTQKLHSLARLFSIQYCNSQCLIASICLALLATVARIWLRSCGNLVGFSPSVILSRYGPTIVVVCTGGFWVLHTLPKDAKSRMFLPWQIQMLPWIVYAIVCVALITVFAQPLSVYVVPRKRESVIVPIYGQTNIIPHLFNQMKDSMQARSKSGDDLPIVYGLATVYSAVLVNVGVFVCLLLALLLGDSLAPSMVLQGTTATLLVAILAAVQYERSLYTESSDSTNSLSAQQFCGCLLTSSEAWPYLPCDTG